MKLFENRKQLTRKALALCIMLVKLNQAELESADFGKQTVFSLHKTENGIQNGSSYKGSGNGDE